jgi:hypothetical protein
VDLQVAPIETIVIGDHQFGELDVLVAQRLQRAVELLNYEIKATERGLLEGVQLLLEVRAPVPVASRTFQ